MRFWESERSCLVLNKLKLFATQISIFEEIVKSNLRVLLR